MFGCNLINFFLLIPQRNPEEDKPLIDYQIALVLLPTVILGTDLGSTLNLYIPDLYLLLVFILLSICR